MLFTSRSWAAMVVLILLSRSPFVKTTNVRPNDPNQHGLTIFYKMQPSTDQIKQFSSGDFAHAPPSPFECGPDPSYPFKGPSFSCLNPALTKGTPSDIYAYREPSQPCLSSLGVAFEHFQWATWTHACWAHPVPAIDTPEGHAEAAFQSTAIAFRDLVLYQHDKHLLALNQRIDDLRLPKDAELLIMRQERDNRLAEVDASTDAEIEKQPDHADEFHGQRDKRKAEINADADRAIADREKTFWRESWEHRKTVVEIDHLVGEYFERWMRGRTQGGFDWAGMGLPEPAWPPHFVIPLF